MMCRLYHIACTDPLYDICPTAVEYRDMFFLVLLSMQIVCIGRGVKN